MASTTDVTSEMDWEIVTAPPQSSFIKNIVAKNAMGQMAMTIGSTTSRNHHHLFLTVDEIPEDELLNDSVRRWSEKKISPSVSSIYARMPPLEEDDDLHSDTCSYDMIDDPSICVKQEETENTWDNYSIYSDDERKIPAQETAPLSTIMVKQEEESQEEPITLHPLSPRVTNHEASTIQEQGMIIMSGRDLQQREQGVLTKF